MIPQGPALHLQLAAIAGNEPATSLLEIRSKGRQGMRQAFIPVRELDRAASVILNNAQISDVFVGTAPRTDRKGTLDAISNLWCLWADCDDRDSVQALRNIRPLPSIVVRSGSEDHVHAYWPLHKPVAPSWAKRGNQRLALKLGADRAAVDAARILRPCGTLNFKHDTPRPVVCVRLELDVFELGDVVGGLPDDPCYLPAAGRPPTRNAGSDKLIDGIVRTVRQAAVGNRNASLYWAACRVAEHELGVEAVEALRAAALATGLAEAEIDQTLRSALERIAA